jgi:hypothetical protein
VTDKETTRGHAVLLVDKSWSMTKIREEAQEGVNEFRKKQAALKNAKITLSLYEFSDEATGRAGYWKQYGPVKAKDAPDYALEPDGNTALYDAVVRVLLDTEKEIAAMKHRPDKVVVALMTDGKENSSKEATFEAAKQQIDRKKEEGWEIIFLAGSLESVAFGKAVGITTTGYNPRVAGQTNAVYSTASAATADFFAGTTRSVVMPETVDADAKSE